MQQRRINVTTLECIRETSWGHDIDIINKNVLANTRARANNISRVRRASLAGSALEVCHLDVTDREVRRELIAEREVLLAVALSDFNGVVDVLDEHAVVGDVVDAAGASTALEVTGESSGRSRPHLDACTVGSILHCDVGDEDVLHDVGLAFVLAERADTDAVASITVQVLDNDLGAVGLEADAVVAVVDHTVLNDNVGAAVGIPAIGVLRRAFALTGTCDVDVVERDARTVGDPGVVLRRVAENQIGDRTMFEASYTKQDGAENVDVLGVEVVPGLTVTIEHAAPVHVHILATKLEEGGGVLESLVEGVGLPVVGVIGELDIALDV